MPRYAKTDYDGFCVDVDTRAVINRNEQDYLTYKRQVAEYKRIKALEDDVNSLKKDMSDIKSLLHAIYGKLNG
jgi:glutaredoxin 2